MLLRHPSSFECEPTRHLAGRHDGARRLPVLPRLRGCLSFFYPDTPLLPGPSLFFPPRLRTPCRPRPWRGDSRVSSVSQPQHPFRLLHPPLFLFAIAATIQKTNTSHTAPCRNHLHPPPPLFCARSIHGHNLPPTHSFIAVIRCWKTNQPFAEHPISLDITGLDQPSSFPSNIASRLAHCSVRRLLEHQLAMKNTGSYPQGQWSGWAYDGSASAFAGYAQLPSYAAYLPESMELYDTQQSHLVHHQQMSRTTETKPRLSKEEVEILEAEFQKNHKPNSSTKKALAESMRVDNARINVFHPITATNDLSN